MAGQFSCKTKGGGTGDRPTVGFVLVHQPRGENEKKARGWDHLSIEVLVVDVGLQVNQQRLRSRTKPRGQDEKEARAGTAAPTMESEAWRDHFGSIWKQEKTDAWLSFTTEMICRARSTALSGLLTLKVE